MGAILHALGVLFLDEPTIGLDIISKQRIRSFLREIQDRYGVTLLLTSHDMDDIERVCDRVMVISNGAKIYDNSLESLMRQYTKDRFVKFVFHELPEPFESAKLGEIIETGEFSYTMKTESSKLPELVAKVPSE